MKKWRLGLTSIAILVILGWVVTSRWFWSLPFMPAAWRSRFVLNANILPASDDSRAQFVAINPGFRAEFGDKDNPESAFLRFEKTALAATDSDNADVNANLLDSLAVATLISDYSPGIEWQLFHVGIDEAQLLGSTQLQENEEIFKITRELLGEEIVATPSSELTAVASEREQIVTETVVERFQGYDQVANMAVATDVDLKYTVIPGRGITSNIWIGDRRNFDTACLQLLSLTGSDTGCNLPHNKFSFLLQLDDGQQLRHDPLAIDESNHGTYYIVDRDGKYLFRLGNPILRDSAGRTSTAVTMDIRRGEVDGLTMERFYIVTMTANLGWLIDSERQFPVVIESGFYIDGGELFVYELPVNSGTPGLNDSDNASETPSDSDDNTTTNNSISSNSNYFESPDNDNQTDTATPEASGESDTNSG